MTLFAPQQGTFLLMTSHIAIQHEVTRTANRLFTGFAKIL